VSELPSGVDAVTVPVGGERFDVVCVGAVNVDTIVPVDSVPGDDERTTSGGFVTAGGGPAATAAVTIARLGGRAAFCGVVGDDPWGAMARRALESEGVDTRWLLTRPGEATARAVVITARSTGGRSIITTVAPAPMARDVPVGRSPWLHVDQIGFGPARAALATAAGRGTRLSVDAGNPISGLTLAGVDLYVPTAAAILERYSTQDIGAAMTAARREGAAQVVVTAGAAGCYTLIGNTVLSVPAFEAELVSTLGAGDVFHGALLAALTAGDHLVDAVAAASATAAISCRAIDGRSGIPTSAELAMFLATVDQSPVPPASPSSCSGGISRRPGRPGSRHRGVIRDTMDL
jgi:sulfofructose kinase